MPPPTTTLGARRKLPPGLRGGAVRPPGSRPSDLNDRNILDRFAGDIGTLLTNLPRAFLDMGGAVVGDTVGSLGRQLIPGGRQGLRDEDGNFESQIFDSIVKPMAQSFKGTADLFQDIQRAPILLNSEEGRERLMGHARDFSEHPGLFAVEHIGNVAIGGAGAGQVAKAAARRAAGVSAKGLTRGARATQIAEIAESGGPGSTAAAASQAFGGAISHPYRAAGRAAMDAKLPKLSALRKGEGVSIRDLPRNHSLRDVLTQVKESTPADRMVWTDEMRAQADARRAAAEAPEESLAVDALSDLAGTDSRATSFRSRFGSMEEFEQAAVEGAGRLPEEQRRLLESDEFVYHGAASPLDSFSGGGISADWTRSAAWSAMGGEGELLAFRRADFPESVREALDRGVDIETADDLARALGDAEVPQPVGRIEGRELFGDAPVAVDPNVRLAPRAIEEMSSPLARDVRKILNLESVQSLTEPLAKASRQTRGMVQKLKEDRTNASFDVLTTRDPGARRTLAIRQIRDLGQELDLESYGIEVPGRMGKISDKALAHALDTIRRNPELREKLPRLEQSLELTLLDLYEKVNGLPDGALRNQLYDDATLTPGVADRLRNLQREGTLPDDLPPELRQAADDALGQSYRIPDEQLANPVAAHPQIADVYRGALRQLTSEAAERDVVLARYGLGDPERWAMRVTTDDPMVGAAQRDLQIIDSLTDPTAYWHGSATRLGVGDELRPGSEVGQRVHSIEGTEDASRVYMSRDVEGARNFSPKDGRAGYLYRVGPASTPVEGRMTGAVAGGEWTTDAARVLEVYDLSDAAVRESVRRYRSMIGPDGKPSRGLGLVREDLVRKIDEAGPPGQLRAMTPEESPSLLASPSSRQARTLRTLGRQVQAVRKRMEDTAERAAKTADDTNVYERYRTAASQQRRAAVAWDRARRAGDEDLAAQLRKDLDAARTRASKAKVDARKDIYTASRGASRAIESILRSIASKELPVGAAEALTGELKGLIQQLDGMFAEADVAVSPALRRALERIDEANIDLGAVDANALDNLLRHADAAEGDVALWADAVRGAKDAVAKSADVRGRVSNVESLVRAEERAKVAARNLDRLERRLDSADGRLASIDPDALDAARVRLADETDLARDIARRAGRKVTEGTTPAAQRSLEDSLLRQQIRAKLRQREAGKAASALERMEQKFAEVEAEMRQSIEAAPAVARPILQVGRAMHQLDEALRESGLTHVADDLDLKAIPRTLEAMEAAGVSPTFLRRLEDRLAAQGYRASSEQPVKTPTMRAQRRREMSDVEVQRDVDRVKSETDIELAGRVLAGEMVETFQRKFGRTPDQIAEGLIESGTLDRNAWRDMTKHQREKLLQQHGYNVYAPDQIFSFKVRRTGADDVWIPKFLDGALTEYAKMGTIERVLTQVVNPATTTWKHFVLALRPAWHIYNVVGGAAMAGIAGGTSVRAYLEYMRPGGEARKLLRQHRLGWDLQEAYKLTPELAAELLDTGLSRDLLPNQRLRGKLSDALVQPEATKRFMESRTGDRAGRALRGAQKGIGASYRANAFMDNLNRTSLYLYDTLQRGMDPEDAVRHANRVLGDYTSMTPTEKIYLRSVFPFYAWMRHITRLSADMLKPDNITRAAAFGSVVNTVGQPNGMEEFFPEYMAGDVLIPGTDVAVAMRGFNPWQDVLDTVVYNGELSLRGMTRSMHPAEQFRQERMSGIDTLTGRPFSRPVPVLDDLGREIPTPPSLGEHAFQKFAPPQLDLLRDLSRKVRGETTSRYSTGDPVLIEGAREPSLLGGIGSFLGAPLRFPGVEGIEERRADAMDRVSRQIARYAEEVEAYEQERKARSLPEKLIPFGR